MGIMIGAYLNPTERRPIHEVLHDQLERPSIGWGPGMRFTAMLLALFACFFFSFLLFSNPLAVAIGTIGALFCSNWMHCHLARLHSRGIITHRKERNIKIEVGFSVIKNH